MTKCFVALSEGRTPPKELDFLAGPNTNNTLSKEVRSRTDTYHSYTNMENNLQRSDFNLKD
jgi:hypothetical protein